MKTIIKGISLLTIFFLMSQVMGASTDKRSSSVIQLAPQNFQDAVYSSLDTWLIYLYAPWCNHCTKLKPQWQKVAKRLEGKVKVAKIDPSDNKFRPKFNEIYGLVGFPRIVIVPAGVKDKTIYDVFEGLRNIDDIVDWTHETIKMHKAFAVERILSEAQWKENCLETSANLCFITILPKIIDSSESERAVYIQTVKQVAKTLRGKPLSFLWAQAGNHPEFQQTFGLSSGYPVSLIISPQKKAFTLMRSSLTSENLDNWLNELLRSKGGRGWKRLQQNIVFNNVQLTQQTKNEDLSDGFSEEQL